MFKLIAEYDDAIFVQWMLHYLKWSFLLCYTSMSAPTIQKTGGVDCVALFMSILQRHQILPQKPLLALILASSLLEFQDVLSNPKILPPYYHFDYCIPLQPETRPIHVKPYRYERI